MGCVDSGDLRAFLDAELAGTERARVEEHLASCFACRSDLEALRANAAVAQSALGRMAPRATEVPRPDWSRVRDRAEGRIRGPVTLGWGLSSMFGNLFRLAGGSRMRVATSTLAALAIVALLSTLSPVQTAASSLLSIFRVKKFVAVTVDPSSLPNLASPGELGSFTTTGDPKPRVLNEVEAAKAVGFKVPFPATLPAGLEAKPRAITVTGAHSWTFTPDLKKVGAYLSSIGASEVKLPDNLDGAPITLQMPPAVSVLYVEKGASERDSAGVPVPAVGGKFLYVGATTSPTMNLPEGIDVDRIRAEVLKMPGLSPDLVNQLRAIDDWRSTVVVPVVKGTSREVTVQGERGLMITQADGKGSSLIWLKGGIVYGLSGSLSEAEILAAANSIG